MRAQRSFSDVRLPSSFEAMVPWGPVLVGLGVMVGLLISAFALPINDNQPPVVPDDTGLVRPTAEFSPSADASDPAAVDDPPTRQGRSSRHTPTPSPSAEPSPYPPSSVPPAKASVVGGYKLVSSYGDGFIGKVFMFNRSYRHQNWTVELEFPSNVGELNGFWVDGATQPTVSRSGNRYLFIGGESVGGRDIVRLKVHFDRSGYDVTPSICRINGVDCFIH